MNTIMYIGLLILVSVCTLGTSVADEPVSSTTLSSSSDTTTVGTTTTDTPLSTASTSSTTASTTSVTTTESTTTNAETTTASTTTESTTTTTKSTTTTASTTTTKSTTTTTKSTTTTTTKSTTTTTTKSTTTTTIAAPSPTPTPPSADTDPDTGFWNGTSSTTGDVCILAKMGLQLRIVYPTVKNASGHMSFNVPANASADGGCDSTDEGLLLTFPLDVDTSAVITLTFSRNSTLSTYRLADISVMVPVTDRLFPDHLPIVNDGIALSANLTSPIELSLNKSYRCLSHQLLQMVQFDSGDDNATSADNSSVTGQLLLMHAQLEAYRTTNTSKFSNPLVCAADHEATSDVVPIAVGVTLAILVVAILTGYVIARRRSRQGGYQSV